MTTDTTMVNRLFDFSRGFILKCLTSFKIAVCAFFVSRDVASCEKQDKSRSRCKWMLIQNSFPFGEFLQQNPPDSRRIRLCLPCREPICSCPSPPFLPKSPCRELFGVGHLGSLNPWLHFQNPLLLSSLPS